MNSGSGRQSSWWSRSHAVEYAAEALGLGLFLMAACLVTMVLEHPKSWVHQQVDVPWVRRLVAGAAMGLTLVGMVYSPWGRRSGAHLNPVVTLVFAALGKVAPRDVLGYIAAQFLGGALGVAIMAGVAQAWLADPAVRYVVTTPGWAGVWAAFWAEGLISLTMVSAVLVVSRNRHGSRFTGWVAAGLLCLFILIESPLSGTSMNPARTVATALASGEWRGWWIYFVAPTLGMFAGAGLLSCVGRSRTSGCAKLCHDPRFRCVFCEHQAEATRRTVANPPSPGL
ncbi:MAG: aquaporin [Verrucomicrobiales bacterium]|nr:aquaporin [Verrucomicrobiales bacterium]